MSIVGRDDRGIVINTMADPFDSVVAIDTRVIDNNNNISPPLPNVGSGIIVGPNEVLTAGHVLFNGEGARITLGQNISLSNNFPSRTQTPLTMADDNVSSANFNYLVPGYNGGVGGDDIALARSSQTFTTDQQIGLVAFVNPGDANGRTVTTAGYPAAVETINLQTSNNEPFLIRDQNGNLSAPFNYASGAFQTDALVQFTATGTIDSTKSDGEFNLSPEIDIEPGQSGSGYWTVIEGDTLPRVLGVVSYQMNTIGTGGIRVHPGDNFGALITTDIYDRIAAAMLKNNPNLSGNDLPENAIIGTDSERFRNLQRGGKDNIFGSFRRERIIGQGGNDRLFGGGGDDRLDGGKGVDQAFFSDEFKNYTLNIDPLSTVFGLPLSRVFEFDHTSGTQTDGKDATKDIEFGVFEFVDANNDGNDDDGNLFFVPLQVDPKNKKKLKDGPEITPEKNILDRDGKIIGTVTVESPAWTFDGNIDYTLTIGSEQSLVHNFAYIIDVSGSMRFRERLAQAQAAYEALTESLIKNGIAKNSTFAVVPFNSIASAIGPLSAQQAISTVNGLRAGGNTDFGPALSAARNFFNSTNNNGTNIAYFLSDGVGSGASELLQEVAEVRAFGIGGADLEALNIIDSDNAVLLNNPADLFTEFDSSIIDRNTIKQIDVKLGEAVKQTIMPAQLTENNLGLQFQGTIDELEVSRTAENEIVFDVIFNDQTPTVSLEYSITTGQEQVIQQTKNGTKEVITFSVNQSDFISTSVTGQSRSGEIIESDFTPTSSVTDQLISREIIGNDLDNTITVENLENTIFGNGGNDRFIILGGNNLIDGGPGIDTVVLDITQAEAGEISQTGDLTNVGTDTTLIDVEFIQFSDTRLATDTLVVTPVLSLVENGISITEGDPNANLATFTINLSTVTTEEVVVGFNTESRLASEGVDFVGASGELTIAAGEDSGEITIEVLNDTKPESEELVLLNLTAVSGATFADGATKETAGLNIVDDDQINLIALQLSGFSDVLEGNPDDPSPGLTLSLERLGDLSGSDTIEVEIVAAGSNPAQAADFTNGFSTTQVTWAPGETIQTVEVPIVADLDVEEDETFGIQLRSVSGSAEVDTENTLFTIVNDDAELFLFTEMEIGSESAVGIEITDGIDNFTNAQITIDATLDREAAFENTLGFYLADAASGGAVVDPSTGQVTRNSAPPNRADHLQAALSNSVFNSNVPFNNESIDINETFEVSNLDPDAELLVIPYLISNGTVDEVRPNFSNLYTAFEGINSDRKEHVRLLSKNTLGFEDLPGGGDNDFNDLVFQLNTVDIDII